jgi:crotonobetaine/carnitine-CoA ligase
MTMPAIVTGGAVAILPTFSKSRFWNEVRAHGCTVMCGFTAILVWLLANPESPTDRNNTLRVGIIAGLPPDLKERFEARFGVMLDEQYGMTESDPFTVPDRSVSTPPFSAGRVNPDYDIAILDGADNPVESGRIGEIAIRPKVPGVMMLGYENDPAATVAAWRNLWFHTGDIGMVDAEGFVYFKGRLKDCIRRRGENISALEIETILMQNDAVADCAAVGVPSEVGEEDVKVAVVLKPGAGLHARDVVEFCRPRMARFMVPRYVQFFDQIPRTNLGKADKARIKADDSCLWDAEADQD